ncbi:MAG TPA: peptidoglycan-binding protein [Thermodesulfobacteriota bacterium]|nr:peptidoglycan-binding protein [Thermodesulfobacteriota bacterium]
MATVKRITDLTDYASVLPYSSELFGIYQPLLGWKSVRIKDRIEKGYETEKPYIIDRFKNKFAGLVDITYKPDRQIEIRIKPGALQAGKLRLYDSVVLEQIAAKLPPYEEYKPSVWARLITPDHVDALLKKDVTKTYTDLYKSLGREATGMMMSRSAASPAGGDDAGLIELGAFEQQLQYESSVAGALLHLVKEKGHDALEEIFYSTRDTANEVSKLIKMLAAKNGAEAYLDIESLDPSQKEHIQAVALSPISVVHLFRQYFFELDTFLGTPVSHVWLSPGSSVELIEVHTRRTVVEKTLETTLDILTKAETSTTQQDEISDAVKENNQQDVKFGASVKASYASIEATSSFDYSRSQQQAREQTHKRTREQTEKLSSEIRKNFKSTFKTVTEFTDQSSTKHTLANSTQELINYELRRKMRQVGVQVQDIGTFLCWQTYVDDPGKELGLAKLIHIAKPAELGAIPHPEEIPTLQPFQEEKIVTVPFISVAHDADNEDEVYKDGVEVDDSEFMGELEKIKADFVQEFVSPKSGYQLTNVEFDAQGKPVQVSRRGGITNAGGKASFTLHLDMADFQGQNSLQVKIILHWSPGPGANDAINAKNAANLAAFKEKEKAEYEKAFVENVKDRVTKASKITTRPSEELREEERIVVYRRLIQEMLLHGVTLPDDRTRHVVSELINSMFDVDKMLYFVAPEWWRPRLHRSRQQLGETPPQVRTTAAVGKMSTVNALQRGFVHKVVTTTVKSKPDVMSASSVGWGGINDVERDNYYITDESEPAKLGSSLGWLLQLDGDNMRNAFLNAPWVKAVIPIRPGREEAAINWLKGVEGMNGITDDVIYHSSNPGEKDINGNPLDGQKMIDVLMDLAKKIKKKYQEGIETGKYPKQDEVSDPALVDEESVVTATPIDRVYEHGFYPLQGGFRANVGKNYEIFDQWIEILPTDQIVPVEVKYDPKTGRQVL